MCQENLGIDDVNTTIGFQSPSALLVWPIMVPPARFQRATFRLGGGRSMQLSYGSTCEVNRKW